MIVSTVRMQVLSIVHFRGNLRSRGGPAALRPSKMGKLASCLASFPRSSYWLVARLQSLQGAGRGAGLGRNRGVGVGVVLPPSHDGAHNIPSLY